MRRWVWLASALLICALGANALPTTVTDDFAKYAAGGDGSPGWLAGSGVWTVKDGALCCTDAYRAVTQPANAPYARRATIEATLTISKITGKEWKLAGIGLFGDDANYWHLVLAERPNSGDKGHFVELTEMYHGQWLSNLDGPTKLAVIDGSGTGFNWQFDHPYRLRITLSAEQIMGEVCEPNGPVLARLAYKFTAPAVTAGRPALVSDSVVSAFTRFSVKTEETAPAPPKPTFPAYASKPGAVARGKATGFFHVERIDGRWWTIDPKGNSFYVVGTDHVNYNVHFCEKLGYAPYHRSVEAKFGDEQKWAANSIARLKAWGFNALGAGCGPSTRHRGLPHTEFLSLGANFTAVSDIAPRTTWTGFPDVFHPRFPQWCEQQARRVCAPHLGDPWLIGYFIDNELEWFGKNGSPTGLVDETFKKPADHPAKQALIAMLKKRYASIDALNTAWGVKLASWDALAQTTEPIASTTNTGLKDRADFVLLIEDRYFAITTAAIRKIDPKHMVIGCRFAGYAPPGAFAAAGRYCDIVTVNYYGRVDQERGVSTDMPGIMDKYYAEAKRPLMMTEWSFPALDAGLPCKGGAGQRVPTQKDKARCFDIYQRTLFGLPYMVGSDYFMWADEPAQGISTTFPEDSNYGLVDVNDNVWVDLTQAATKLNPMAQRLHGGLTAELSATVDTTAPGKPVVVVRNTGRSAASFVARIWQNGRRIDQLMTIKPNAKVDCPLALPNGGLVTVQLDPDRTVTEANQANNYAEKMVLSPQVKRPSVAIYNPTGTTVRNVPVSIALGSLGPGWTVDGSGIRWQVDNLPSGPELAIIIDELPAYTSRVLALKKADGGLSVRQENGAMSPRGDGGILLSRDEVGGSVVGSVALDGVALGQFRILVHQSGPNVAGWNPSDCVDSLTTWSGPARTVSMVTTSGGKQPGQFRVTARIDRFADEPWFGARLQSVQNTDKSPWKLEACFLQPYSAINGNSVDDQPVNADAVHQWFDAGAGAVYGAVVSGDKVNASFWKDTADAVGEHPDIWRDLDVTLQRGATFTATADDPTIIVYGARTAKSEATGPTIARLKALARIKSVLVR